MGSMVLALSSQENLKCMENGEKQEFMGVVSMSKYVWKNGGKQEPVDVVVPPLRCVSMPRCNSSSLWPSEYEIGKAELKVCSMRRSACSASIQKTVKQMEDALIDVIPSRAHVVPHPSFLNEGSNAEKIIEDAVSEAIITEEDVDGTSARTVCRLRIKGMTCNSCSTTVKSALKRVQGVNKASVSPATEEAEIRYDPNQINYKQLINAVVNAGYKATLISTREDKNKVHLKLERIPSEGEIRVIRNSLQALPGVEDTEVDAQLEKITVSFNPDLTGPRTFIDVIEGTCPGSCKATLYQPGGLAGAERSREIKQYYMSFLWSLVFSVPVFFLNMIFIFTPAAREFKLVNMLTVGELLRFILSTPVQFIIARRFYTDAYNSLRHGSVNTDVLIALGTNVAYFYSVYTILRAATDNTFKGTDYFGTSAMRISFILLGKYLEVLAKAKTSEAIAKLMNLSPAMATLLTLDSHGNVLSERTVSSLLIQRNDIIKILPGEKVPVDGLVVWGRSHVNESMIRGEARPVTKRIGDEVIGGTVNENGVLHIRVTQVRPVETIQMVNPPVQKFADKIASFLVPMVIVLSFSTWLEWFVAGMIGLYPKSWIPSSMDEFELALQFGISVLVIACPCAVSLATPIAVMVATQVGAMQGVLMKGGEVLERAHKVNCIIFDKTGTLTVGKPIVVDTKFLQNKVPRDFYKIVAAAEAKSEHPVAQALVEYAKTLGEGNSETRRLPEVQDFVWVTGHGVRARVHNKNILVGNIKLMLDSGISVSEDAYDILNEAEGMARTAVLVSIDRELVAIITVSDSVRPEAKEVVSILKLMKIKSIMVTGDNWSTAKAIAKEVGIETVNAEMLPKVKAEKVKELQMSGMTVAMVGDGNNDSPALAAADVAMALGAGTDIAIEAADIVLMRSNLEDVITAIDLSKSTFNRIRLNYLWALGYNVMAIPLAGGLLFPFTRFPLPPWISGAAMGASSLSVVCCSLLLRYYKRPRKLDLFPMQAVKI